MKRQVREHRLTKRDKRMTAAVLGETSVECDLIVKTGFKCWAVTRMMAGWMISSSLGCGDK
jgi:hypothetical protein